MDSSTYRNAWIIIFAVGIGIFLLVAMKVSNVKGVIYGIPFAGVGLYLFFKGFDELNEKGLLEGTPVSNARSVAMGFCQVAGKTIPVKDKLVCAPFSQKQCVYCTWTIQEKHHGKNGSYWVDIKTGTLGGYFFLRDATGQVTVNAQSSSLEGLAEHDFEYPPKKEPEHIKAFLEQIRVSDSSFLGLFGRELKYVECCIEPDATLYVFGTAVPNDLPDQLTTPDGKSSDVLIQKGNQRYIISTRSEREIVSGFNNWSKIGIILGALFMLGGLAMIASALELL